MVPAFPAFIFVDGHGGKDNTPVRCFQGIVGAVYDRAYFVDSSPNFSRIRSVFGISNVVAGFSPRSAPLVDTVFRNRTLAEARDYIMSCSSYRTDRKPEKSGVGKT